MIVYQGYMRMTFYQGFVVDGPGQLSSKMYDSGNKADSIASHKQSARDDKTFILYFICEKAADPYNFCKFLCSFELVNFGEKKYCTRFNASVMRIRDGFGSLGSFCFWASRIHFYEVRIRILLSSSKY
jgi:hypothetical protein